MDCNDPLVKDLIRELDACFCDDGRGDPECDRCLEIRAELYRLGWRNEGEK